MAKTVKKKVANVQTKQESKNMKCIIIKTGLIEPSKSNPRTVNIKSPDFAELLLSVKASGIIFPPIVRVHPKKKGSYELLDGERRFTAATLAGIKELQCTLYENITDEQAFEITFFSKFAVCDLTPLEEGCAAVTLLQKYSGDIYAVASRLGKSVRWVAQRAAIDGLSKKVKALITEDHFEDWTASHLQHIVGLGEETQLSVLQKFKYNTPTVADVAKHVTNLLRTLAKAPWNVATADSVIINGKKKVVKCCQCLNRSSAQPGLFDDSIDAAELKKNDRCTYPECWKSRATKYVLDKATEVRKAKARLVCITEDYTNHPDREELKALYGQVMFEQKLLKRGGKNTLPAIVVTGAKAGTEGFVRIDNSSSATSKRPKDAEGNTIKKPLAERRKELEKKRWFKVLSDFREVISQSTTKDLGCESQADLICKVVTLTCYVGTCPSEIQENRNEYGRADMAKFDKFESISVIEDRIEMLFRSTLPQLQEVVSYNGPLTQTPDGRIDQAKAIAKLLKYDIAALLARVVKEIPEPKSWATEAKEKKPAKAAKPKAEKKAKKK